MNDAQRLAYLKAMGIDVYVPRHSPTSGPAPEPRALNAQSADLGSRISDSSPEPRLPNSDSPERSPRSCEVPVDVSTDASRLNWSALRERVAGCTACALHTTRTQTVFGVGSQQADWLFIGEGPGVEEDRRGEPFVGRAGQLLDNMLRAIGLRREQVYIANIVKCRPPKNRDPRAEEALACQPYLRRQIELLNPKVIIALGRVAAQNLLRTEAPLGKLRGRQFVYADTSIALLVTYHPAYLLRSPADKRKAWQDLVMARKVLSSV